MSAIGRLAGIVAIALASAIGAAIPSGPSAATGGPEVISHGPRTAKVVALTYDADMTPWMYRQWQAGNSYVNKPLVKWLEDEDIPATLFLTGLWMKAYPELTRELAAQPNFELGTHSWSHPGFSQPCYGLPSMPAHGPIAEVEKARKLLDSLAGDRATNLFRFPGGCHAGRALSAISGTGVTVVDWDSSGDDGHAPSATFIADHALANVRPGSIILLHMHGSTITPLTDEASKLIVARLRARGYSLATVGQLLGRDFSSAS